MKKEIDLAVETFHNIAFGTRKGSKQSINDQQLASFVTILTELLVVRYENIWYPRDPIRGSGYRCLRINGQCVDPAISKSLRKSKILLEDLRTTELTIWVDPGVVSVRIGEEGSIGSENIDIEELIEDQNQVVAAAPRSPPRGSEDEAYSSESPSPPPHHLRHPILHHPVRNARRRNHAVQNPPIHHHPNCVAQLNVSPPSNSSQTSIFNPSQEYQPSVASHIPTQANYSRPRNLFPDRDSGGDGQYMSLYKNNLLTLHQSHQAAMVGHMPRMVPRGHYLDIPAQA